MSNQRNTSLPRLFGILAAFIFASAIPAVSNAETISVCLNKHGLIERVNKACTSKMVMVTWVTVGPTGIQGPQGPIGQQGPQGPQGLQGLAGAQGPAGAPGAQGPAGSTGPAGSLGPQGALGPAGTPGATGPLGAAGATGPNGADGASGSIAVNAVTLTGGTAGSLTNNSTNNLLAPVRSVDSPLYMPPGGSSDAASGAEEPQFWSAVPLLGGANGTSGGTLGHYFVHLSTAPGGGGGYQFAACLFTSLTTAPTCTPLCTVTDTATTCSSTATTVDVPAGTPVTIEAYSDPSAAATPSATTDVAWSMTYTHN